MHPCVSRLSCRHIQSSDGWWAVDATSNFVHLVSDLYVSDTRGHSPIEEKTFLISKKTGFDFPRYIKNKNTTSVAVNSKRICCTLRLTLMIVLRLTLIAEMDPPDMVVNCFGIIPPPLGVATDVPGSFTLFC